MIRLNKRILSYVGLLLVTLMAWSICLWNAQKAQQLEEIVELRYASDILTLEQIKNVQKGEAESENKLLSNLLAWRQSPQKEFKNKELSKIKQSFSVDFIPKKCACACFINDNDLWIKHRDYFSSSYRKPEDVGMPLSYKLKKYSIAQKKEKFIYSDNWGSIVLRNESWLCFKNIMPIILRNKNAHKVMLDLMIQNDENMSKNNDYYEMLMEWERFFEKVTDECRNYIKKNKMEEKL